MLLAKPFIQMFPYESVILKVRISLANSLDFFNLAGRQILVWIEAPAPCNQPLSSQNLMNPGNTSPKLVGSIKNGCIRVSKLSPNG